MAGWIEQQGGGLKFECTQCGDCCSNPQGIVLVSERERVRLANRMKLPLAEFDRLCTWSYDEKFRTLKTTPQGCILFDPNTRLCTVYRDHPLQCRTYPFWVGTCGSQEAWEKTSKKCPGCNRGNFIPLDKIKRCVVATTRINE